MFFLLSSSLACDNLSSCTVQHRLASESIRHVHLCKIKHTYLITIIFGNCYEELISITISKSQENIIKDMFTKKKEEFKSFINTILINSNKINNKLYNRTVILAKNLVFFEVNTLQIPNMVKIILENTNKSNIDSTSKLVSKCIEYSKCKKMEDDFGGLDLSEYDKKMNKEESLSLNIIIEYIYLYINNNNNKIIGSLPVKLYFKLPAIKSYVQCLSYITTKELMLIFFNVSYFSHNLCLMIPAHNVRIPSLLQVIIYTYCIFNSFFFALLAELPAVPKSELIEPQMLE